MTTKFQLPITITLKDPRYCTGCRLRYGLLCPVHHTKRREWRTLRYDRTTDQCIRLPQCIAAAQEAPNA